MKYRSASPFLQDETEMTKYLVLYSFHKVTPLSFHRLFRLKNMNHEITIVPFFGNPQKIILPGLVDSRFTRNLNMSFLGSPYFNNLSRALNTKAETIRRQAIMKYVRDNTARIGLTAYCDFTPLGYYNLDIAILRWFSGEGHKLDFDFLIFFEYDIFATKTIDELYGKSTRYDGAFVSFSEPPSSWAPGDIPRGAKKSVQKWLGNRGFESKLRRCLFGGNMVARRVLQVLQGMQLPNAHCELRWPSIISGLGFSCGNLPFPMVKYRPVISRSFIEKNPSYGIFHPVYDDFCYQHEKN
jgi:hypothetical protein